MAPDVDLPESISQHQGRLGCLSVHWGDQWGPKMALYLPCGSGRLATSLPVAAVAAVAAGDFELRRPPATAAREGFAACLHQVAERAVVAGKIHAGA